LRPGTVAQTNQALPVRFGLLPEYMSLQHVVIANEVILVSVVTNVRTACCTSVVNSPNVCIAAIAGNWPTCRARHVVKSGAGMLVKRKHQAAVGLPV
jgi:hypothetical protein